jgi:hypothetical protein
VVAAHGDLSDLTACSGPRRTLHNCAAYGALRPTKTLDGMAVGRGYVVRMGSPVRFRRGAPHRNRRSGLVQHRACRRAERLRPPLARDLPARFDRFASMHGRRWNLMWTDPRSGPHVASTVSRGGRQPLPPVRPKAGHDHGQGLMTNDGLTEPFSKSRRCTSGCLEPATTGRTGARAGKEGRPAAPARAARTVARTGAAVVAPGRHPAGLSTRHGTRVGTLSGAPCPAGPHSRRWSCRPSRPVGVSAIAASRPCVCEEDAACGLQSDAGSL